MKETWVIRGTFAMNKDVIKLTLTPLNKMVDNQDIYDVADQGISQILKIVQQETMEFQTVIFVSRDEFLKNKYGIGSQILLEAKKI